MRIYYKIGAVILTIFVLLFFKNANAQYKYSIDIKSVKHDRATLKTKVLKARENYKIYTDNKKRRHIINHTSKKIRKHAYSIQTQKVKKRMRLSAKKADNFNKGKVPLSVKLKNILNG